MANLRLIGKTAVITGSTQGIGFAIAKKFVNEGCKVMVSSRKQANVDWAIDKLRMLSHDCDISESNIEGMCCHVGKKEERLQLLQKTETVFGPINTLVHNVAINPYFGPICDIQERTYDKIMETNLKCPLLFTVEALPQLKQMKNSSILFISSVASQLPIDGIAAYCMSKAGMNRLTLSLAHELGIFNIRVNCLAPGLIKTKFGEEFVEFSGDNIPLLKSIPLKRMGYADEMGGPAAFLCSDEASYVTGQTLIAAG